MRNQNRRTALGTTIPQFAASKMVQEMNSTTLDRRLRRRYVIQLELRWKLTSDKEKLDSGSGRTLNLSSGGFHFEADRELPVGADLELYVKWPAMLHNTTTLQLVVAGRIIRSSGKAAAIRMVRHEFRTRAIAAHRDFQATVAGSLRNWGR